MSKKELYEATNFAWDIKPERSKNNSIKYAFAIYKNQVKEVYRIDKWLPAKDRIPKTRKIDENDSNINKRFAFDGEIADNIREYIVEKKNFKRLYSGFGYGSMEEARDFYNIPHIYPDEIEDNNLYEGTKKQITVNAYERNQDARKKCIQHYGYICQVCEFNFEKIYGEIGKDFIHVHHIVDISTIGKNYKVDPIKDLIPVCPNCHAMLHKKVPAFSVEDIKNKLNI